MSKLNLGVEVRDFDLEQMGFSLSVLDETNRRTSEGYLRMTLQQLGVFLDALRGAPNEIELTAVNEAGLDKGLSPRPGSGRQRVAGE